VASARRVPGAGGGGEDLVDGALVTHDRVVGVTQRDQLRAGERGHVQQ